MIPNPWLLVPLIILFIVALSLKEDRDKKWVFAMWFPVTAISISGVLFFVFALFAIGGGPNDAAGGFRGLSLFILAISCSPSVFLLYLCLKYKPGRQAYTLHYMVPTIAASIILFILTLILVRIFGARLHLLL
jgi:hypothetical protein